MNILEWLSLVVPALFFAVVIFQFLHRKFRSYFIIVLGGLLLIGGGFYLITILLDYSLAYQRQNCIASRELYECLGKRYIIAYPIIVGIITFIFYFLWSIWFGVLKIRNKRRQLNSA